MRFAEVQKQSSLNRARSAKQVLRAYYSPHVTKLTPEEVLARLRSKASDTGARELLKIATELMERQK